jgi:hypothetical protein
MRRSRTKAALAFALTLGAAVPAVAFQEIPVPPPSPAQDAKPDVTPPALALGTPPSAKDRPTESGGIQIFGYTLMPKLDFGLDLLYGQDQQQLELQQRLMTFDADSDVTVLGRVERRF